MRHTFCVQLRKRPGLLMSFLVPRALTRLGQAIDQVRGAKLEICAFDDADPLSEMHLMLTYDGISLARCIQIFEAEMRRPLSSLAGYRQIETEEA